jgi:hypothetical protein
VQAEEVAGRRAADLRAQQQGRRFDRPAGDDDDRRANGDPARRPVAGRGLGVGVGRLDPGGQSVGDQDPLGAAAGDDLRALGPGVEQIGLRGRELRSRLVAEAHVSGARRVV